MYIREEFRQSLQCGTGKAFFIIKNNPEVDFFDEILDAALTNFAYDPQLEGSRADYVARLINRCDRKNIMRSINRMTNIPLWRRW